MVYGLAGNRHLGFKIYTHLLPLYPKVSSIMVGLLYICYHGFGFLKNMTLTCSFVVLSL